MDRGAAGSLLRNNLGNMAVIEGNFQSNLSRSGYPEISRVVCLLSSVHMGKTRNSMAVGHLYLSSSCSLPEIVFTRAFHLQRHVHYR